MKIQKDEVEHIAELARIKLNDQEKEKYAEELSAILDYVEELEKAPTDEIKTIDQITDLKNIARQDEVVASLTNDDVLLNAPEKQDGFIKVRQILE